MCFTLILQLGLDPHYVFDEIALYEARLYVKYSYLKSKEEWEQTRLQSYITAQCNSTKKIKMTDLIKFPWEHDISKEDTKISNEEIARLRAKAQQYINRN